MKYFTLIVIACCVSTFLQCSPVYAAVSLELSCDGGCAWDIGTVAAEATVNTSDTKYTLTNNSGGYEDFEIKVETTTGTWSARITDDNNNTTNEFILREDTSAGQLITGTNTGLVTDVADQGTYDFGLWFKAPPTGSNEETASLTVTLTASNFTQKNGTICTAHGDCYSGNCVDGYCCDTACNGLCQACDLTDHLGECTYVPDGQDPDGECIAAAVQIVRNERSGMSCNEMCASYVGEGEYCNGSGACQTSTYQCVNIGIDATATNGKYWGESTFPCQQQSGNCGRQMNDIDVWCDTTGSGVMGLGHLEMTQCNCIVQ